MSEYKTIVLLKGLMCVDDYQFKTVKSLLKKELNLTKKMQEDYDRIDLADRMEDTFPRDCGLDKLIGVFQKAEDLKDLAKKLKMEKSKVKKQNKGTNKIALKKTKQDEPSSSTNNESKKNKPFSEKKRKQSMKTEGGKKGKLTQEQTQLPEPSGSTTQINEACLQTPPKLPSTPSSSPSNKKQTEKTIKTDGVKKRKLTREKNQLPEPSGSDTPQNEGCIQTSHEPPPTLSGSSSKKKQKKQQLLKSSVTGNSSGGSKLQTLQGLSAAASSSLQAPQTPLEAGFLAKTSQGSPAPLVQNFPMSPVSDSSITQNSHVLLTQSSSVHVPPVSSARASTDVWVLPMSSVTVSSSLNVPQMSPVSLSSSAQNFHPPTAASFSSMQIPHSPQVTVPRSVQTPRVPSATAQAIQVPLETASSHVEVSHALPKAVSTNTCTFWVPQRAESNSIQFLNSPTVKEPRNAMVSVPLAPGPAYFLAPLESPATASSHFQVSQVLPATTSKGLPGSQMPIPIEASRAQTTEMCAGTVANFIQALHAPPPRVSRRMCTTQVPHEVPSNPGQALSYPKVKTSKSVQPPPMPSVAASKSLLAPCASTPTTSRNLLAPRMSLAETFSDLQVPPATTSCNKSRTPKGRNIPKEPSREEGHHQGPKEVMVLEATEAFTYDLTEDKRMFHATVATESEFFRVKVFDTDLKNKFIPGKIIAMSNYIGFNGFLEIHRASCVSDVKVNRKMNISNALRQSATVTPKIKNLCSQTNGTYVNGVFELIKKNERNDLIYYEIGDDSGTMDVVVYGRLTSIKCEPGNKLHLVCFELTSNGDKCQLRSVRHSYMQVINVKRKDNLVQL